MQRGFAPIVVILLIVVLASMAVGGYYFVKLSKPAEVQKVYQTPTSPAPLTSTPEPTSSVLTQSGSADLTNWKTYTSTRYGFSFQHPPTWYINEENSDGEVNVFLSESADPSKRIISIYASPPGIGCGPVDEDKITYSDFEFGNQTIKSIRNFCGNKNWFILDTKNNQSKSISVWATFVTTPHEQTAREVLKTVQGLTYTKQ